MNMDKKLPYPSELAPTSDDAPPSYINSSSSQQVIDGDTDSQLNNLVARTAELLPISLQPSNQTTMTVLGGGGRGGVAGNRNALSLTIGLDGKREWSHTLCSGVKERPGETAVACCLPCIKYSANRSRLVHLTKNGEPLGNPQHVGLFCCLFFLAPQFLGVGSVALQCLSRYQTRQRFGIRGDVVQDLLVSAFCGPCTQVLESREIEEEEIALTRSKLERSQQAQMDTMFRDEEEAVGGNDATATTTVFVVEEGEQQV